MSDSLNALSDAIRSGNVLEGIMHPATVNPLAALSDATTVAGRIYQLRDQQAQEAWGNALQQATDPQSGVVDFPKAQRIAASMGPIAQMGMAKNLQNTSNIMGQQLEQTARHMSNIGAAALTLVRQPTDDNLEMVRQDMYRSGYPKDRVDQEIDSVKGKGPAVIQQWAYNHGLAAMSLAQPGAALGRAAGETTMGAFGGTSAPQTIIQGTPGTPPQVIVGGGIGHSQSPDAYFRPQDTVQGYNAQNQPVSSNDPSAVRWEKRAVAAGPVMGATPPGSLGAPGGGTSGGATTAAPPPPPPNTQLKGGYQPRPVAQPPAPTPPTPTAGVPTAAPTGAEAQVQKNTEAYTAAQAAIPQQVTTAQTMKRALDVLKLISTGKTQDNVQGLFNFLQGYGALAPGATANLANYEEFRKDAVRLMLDRGMLSGGTDMAREMAGKSNASELLADPTNRTLLLNDLGKQIQSMAAVNAEKKIAGSRGEKFLGNQSDIAQSTDPRGFIWDWGLYTPEEQAQIKKDVANNPEAERRLARAIGMSRQLGLSTPTFGVRTPTGG